MSDDYNDELPATEVTSAPDAPEEKQPLSEALMAQEMSETFDRAQAEGAREDSRHTMPTVPAANLDEAFQNTYDFMSKPEAEQNELRDVRSTIDRVKANAAKWGVEIDEKEAMKYAFELEQQQGGKSAIPAELTPAMESVKSLYGDQVPFHEAAQRYAEIDRMVRSDPVRGLSEIIQGTGHNEIEVLRQMAARHSPVELQHHFAMRDAEVYAEAFLAANPDVDQAALLDALGKIEKTGNYGRDLNAAYQAITGRKGKGKANKPRNLEADMRQTYERMRAQGR